MRAMDDGSKSKSKLPAGLGAFVAMVVLSVVALVMLNYASSIQSIPLGIGAGIALLVFGFGAVIVLLAIVLSLIAGRG